MVAHPIACEGINVTSGKNVILASTAEHFVTEISRLFADNSKRLAIGAGVRHLAESEYSFQRIGEQSNSTVEDIAQRPAGDLWDRHYRHT